MAGEEETATPTTTPTATPQPLASAAPSPTPAAPSIDKDTDYSADNVTVPPEERQGFGARVYHGVLNALGGSNDVALARDPRTGQMVATAVKSGPGQQWKRIIAGALTGAAGGYAAGGTGPGNAARAFAGGFQARAQQNQQDADRQRQHANEDFEMEQKAATAQAQNALLSHQIAQSTFALERARVEASYADTDRENTFETIIANGGEGSTDMGIFPDFRSVVQAFKEMPELHDHQAAGRIVTIPHVNAEGRIDGVHAALVSPDWLSSKINHELPITVRSYKDGKLKEDTYTIPAGTLTGDQYTKMIMGQSQEALTDYLKVEENKQKAALTKAETTKDYAGAAKDEAETRALNEATSGNVIQSNAAQLVEGTMDPSNLSRRSKSYDATIAAANAYSLQKYGRPFDIAKAAGDYKFATNVQTYNTLNYLNSLTGRDNKSGNLGTVIALSQKLAQTKFPPINAVEQWAKISAGNPQVAAYRSAILEVSDQIAKILQGGGTGSGTSDKKLEQAQEVLDKNFNARQIAEVAVTLRDLLGNRKQEIIGDNRYLLQWHGVQQQTAPQQQGQQPGSGKQISILAAKQLPSFQNMSDDEIKTAAEKLGYTVTQ